MNNIIFSLLGDILTGISIAVTLWTLLKVSGYEINISKGEK